MTKEVVMKSVLVVTHRRGFEADLVIDKLRARRVPVFRFNSDAGEEASLITLDLTREPMEVHFMCDGREQSSSDFGVGWCQQLPPYLGQACSTEESLQRKNLWTAHLAAFECLDVPWLNKPQQVLYASNKALQLAQAQKVGLNVPATLISNLPRDIRVFAKQQQTVAKNLATPWVVSPEETRAAYTKIVEPDWLAESTELEFCPVIYQAFHSRSKDYRVVVVGDKVFAAYCKPREGQKADVRRDGGNDIATGEAYQACEFDAPTAQKLQRLMKNLSISYCAADFMEDQQGNIYFLEVNTCGAWWWIDQLYEGRICNAITDYLANSL